MHRTHAGFVVNLERCRRPDLDRVLDSVDQAVGGAGNAKRWKDRILRVRDVRRLCAIRQHCAKIRVEVEPLDFEGLGLPDCSDDDRVLQLDGAEEAEHGAHLLEVLVELVEAGSDWRHLPLGVVGRTALLRDGGCETLLLICDLGDEADEDEVGARDETEATVVEGGVIAVLNWCREE